MNPFSRWALLAAATVLAAGCAASGVKKSPSASDQAGESMPATPTETIGGTPAAGEPQAEGGEPAPEAIPELATVHFPYDKYLLRPDTRKTLQSNAYWLKSNPGVKIQVGGHCDQRGTVEFNLALGEQRARAVKDYYIHLGIAAERIAAISYGNQQPVCTQMSEACWTQNRRAETLVFLSSDGATPAAPPSNPVPEPSAAAGPPDKPAARAPDLGAKSAEEGEPGAGLPEPALPSAPQGEPVSLAPVYFARGSEWLGTEARAALRKNAQRLKNEPGVRIQLVANRGKGGSKKYNLDLVRARARALRAYYVHLGIAAERISILSGGKVTPSCAAEDAACEKENRSVETVEIKE